MSSHGHHYPKRHFETYRKGRGGQERNLFDSIRRGLVALFKPPPNGKAFAIGEGLGVKVNANIGTSGDIADEDLELRKLEAALKAGTDAVMDLSTGGNLRSVRRKIVEASSVPVGSVPIYEAIVGAARKRGGGDRMEPEEILDAIRLHGEDGISFVTVHCGVTLSALAHLGQTTRVCGIVSRGEASWLGGCVPTTRKTPFSSNMTRSWTFARSTGMVLSLGTVSGRGRSRIRWDQAQVDEVVTLGQLFRRARAKGVQAIIEGPGHVPLDQIPSQVMLAKKLCDDAPFYVLGPLVTDIAPGLDHITSAIGGAVAAMHGADFLCYVTPSEHLGLPDVEDVRIGVLAARIAGHAADLVRRRPGAWEWDEKMSTARKSRKWAEQIRLAIDPDLAREIRARTCGENHETCTMCGDLCAYRADSRSKQGVR